MISNFLLVIYRVYCIVINEFLFLLLSFYLFIIICYICVGSLKKVLPTT